MGAASMGPGSQQTAQMVAVVVLPICLVNVYGSQGV